MLNRNTDYWFFSGKGGAGKSSMSSATAVRLAEKGHKTLLVSTDPAPNLSEVFEQEIGERPETVKEVENLSAAELDPDKLTEDFKQKVLEEMRDDVAEDELEEIKDSLDMPCTDEIAAFDAFSSFLLSSKFDKVVMDTAPTGNTLQLLESPFEWIQEIEESADTCIGPATSLTSEKKMYEQAIDTLRSEESSFVFVMRPSRSSLMETQDAVSELSEQGFQVENLIVNGYTPEKLRNSEFYGRKYKSEQYITEKIEGLEIGNILKVPLMPREIRGVERVEDVADILYENAKPEFNLESLSSTEEFSPDKEKVKEKLKESENLFITGKGGSGKTVSALAFAEYAAEQGLDTLFVSVYSHADVEHFYGKLSGSPQQISQQLDAAKIDRNTALKHLRDSKVEEMKDKFENSDFNIDEEATLDKINEQLKSPCAAEKAIRKRLISILSQDYDLKVFDMDPTGDALKIIDKLMNSDSHEKLEKNSIYGINTFPEKSPIEEATRTIQHLDHKYGLDNSFLIVNYLLPEPENDFMKVRKSQQASYLKQLEERIERPMIGFKEKSGELNSREDVKALIDYSV